VPSLHSAQLRLGQCDAFHGFQQIAERGALGAARGLRALLQFLFEIGVVLGAHDHDLQIVVIFDLGDDVIVFQHVLVEQVAEREIFRIIADRHHGDDLLRVQIQRQRPLHRDIDLDRGPGLIGPGNAFGQPRVLRIGKDQGNGRFVDLHHLPQASMTLPVSRYKHPGVLTKWSRHCEPTGRANARPMTGSAKQSRAYGKGWIASSLRSSQ
jgi:hypothetical protein